MWIADLHRWIITLWNSILIATYKMLVLTPDQWGTGASVSPWEVAHTIHTGLLGIGTGLALLFWFISFFKYIDDFHKIDLREVMGWILRFAVIMVIMQFSWQIMEAVLDLSIGINNNIMDAAGIDPAVWDSLTSETAMTTEGFMHESEILQNAVDTVNNFNVLDPLGSLIKYLASFFTALPISIIMLLIWMVVLGCGCIIMVTLYMRFFKMYIYTALAPLPLSTFAGASTTEVGKHFLKAWAGVCLELCVMTIAVVIFASSMSADPETILPFLGDMGDVAGEVAGATPGVVVDPGAVGNAGDATSALWTAAMQWSIGVLIKSVLLVSVLKGSDRILEKMLGV